MAAAIYVLLTGQLVSSVCPETRHQADERALFAASDESLAPKFIFSHMLALRIRSPFLSQLVAKLSWLIAPCDH